MASSNSHDGTHNIFYGPVINPVSLTHFNTLPHCLLSIDPSGKIEWMIDNVDKHQLQETLESKALSDVNIIHLKDGEFLMPGFIDTHTHAPQFPIMGTGSQYKLLDWLNELTFPTESKFNENNVEFVQKTYQSVVRRVLNFGTTTCCYYSSLHLKATMTLADIAHEYGQRAFIGKCNMDTKAPDDYDYIEESADNSMRDTQELIRYIRSLGHDHPNSPESLVQPILTPRFALSCSQDLLSRLGSLATSDPTLRIQTHISENETEILETLKRFPEAKNYADVYHTYGLLRENTILAHAIHLTKVEVELIKKREVGISHCPTSNFNLNSGIAPVGYYLDRGVKVGLGTDVSGGYSPSILNAIQNASLAAKALAFKNHSDSHDHQFANRPFSIATLLYLATAGGAAVCGIEEQVGSFGLGKSFDALLVNVGENSSNPALWGMNVLATPPRRGTDDASGATAVEAGLEEKQKIVNGWLECFLHGGDDRNIEKVYVQGRFVGGRTFSASS